MTNKIAQFSSLEEYKMFMQAVVMKPYLSYLPTDENSIVRNAFVGAFLQKKALQTNSRDRGDKWIIDYVRLNISAFRDSKI